MTDDVMLSEDELDEIESWAAGFDSHEEIQLKSGTVSLLVALARKGKEAEQERLRRQSYGYFSQKEIEDLRSRPAFSKYTIEEMRRPAPAQREEAGRHSNGNPALHDGAAARFFSTFRNFVAEHYGPRCPDVAGGCATCSMWALYDLAVAMTLVDDDEPAPTQREEVMPNAEHSSGRNVAQPPSDSAKPGAAKCLPYDGTYHDIGWCRTHDAHWPSSSRVCEAAMTPEQKAEYDRKQMRMDITEILSRLDRAGDPHSCCDGYYIRKACRDARAIIERLMSTLCEYEASVPDLKAKCEAALAKGSAET